MFPDPLTMSIAAVLIGWPGAAEAIAIDVATALVQIAATLAVLAWTFGGMVAGVRRMIASPRPR